MTPPRTALYLVDASIYIFRGWHVLPDSLRDCDGHPVNAVHGFADFLLQLLEQCRPTYIACGFDISRDASLRKALYPEYKANRPAAPEELQYQFARCRELVATLGIAGFVRERYEADDILGTFAQSAHSQNTPFTVVTADKDLTQLLGKNDYWWSVGQNYWLDYRGVEKRFGVLPGQIAELLALSGDTVDNIPGVPGIGLATAARLLKKWGNIDTLYNNVARVGEMKFRGAKRIQSLLEEHRDTVEIARQLTPVFTDASLPKALDSLRPGTFDQTRVEDIFERLAIGASRRERWCKVLKTLAVGQNFPSVILKE